jgi:hypothetical protein
MIEINIVEKKLLSYNWKLNFLYNGSNYNKFYEWEKHNWFETYEIVMYYHYSPKVLECFNK